MTLRREIFQGVSNAVDLGGDLIIKLKDDHNGKLPIPVGEGDKIAMEILEFLDREHGDLTYRQMEDAIHTASWWLTTTQVL